ncbi:helix-turn-helix domain-containing protein [Spirosoma radiotolerans]|uniref:AraC family transcriptional regulator n=1 Tax=Spirosoma radiotolerans TaxID=1379870 RepID=A0A0E3V9S2_9BACT|nr:helix-turn-helix transcriptional regulator [Spirosoma radiotolerans]AKD57897.1 AraC family transcriptional regulator [Spirosoma radiotolerans]
MLHFNTLSAMRRQLGLTPPEHPQLALERGLQRCPLDGEAFTTDCYGIMFKKLKAGVMLYGRTVYDHANGALSFVKPRQRIEFRNLEVEEDSFLLFVHEDYFLGHPLHERIGRYSYFDYEVSEALHLSPREEQIIWDLFMKIETEYYSNPDEYSRLIILTHLDSLLTYDQRFYKRQFINRTELSGQTVSKFNQALWVYFRDGLLQTEGLPTVQQLAAQLNVSSRYLSDLLKQETGKTAIELIHIGLINEAKNRLKQNELSISEIAYTMGFDNPSYFSRLFKKEVGLTPLGFKKGLVD